MPYFRPHSLTVTAPSNPPPPPLWNVDLGLVLTDCQETVCDAENNTANFVSIFESQTVSWQSAQVSSFRWVLIKVHVNEKCSDKYQYTP